MNTFPVASITGVFSCPCSSNSAFGLIKPSGPFSKSSSSPLFVPNVAINCKGASSGASNAFILISPSLDISIFLKAGRTIGCKSFPKTKLPSPSLIGPLDQLKNHLFLIKLISPILVEQ